jgi:hypothetical protein
MDQPSREAMAGKLQIYADRESTREERGYKCFTPENLRDKRYMAPVASHVLIIFAFLVFFCGYSDFCFIRVNP